ncbi:hypothetical protein IMG5_076390 [Ichthyophthirius multifiliis]|uniref:Uncharacterized protein n=1 Tax=Ichthyophthirius multifiliis TaxID=5932 RepID=G0QQA8_ICHMU|nr:hypothetical protein IMG5_076390 [Ichthyophthirius multifiliis]EGR32609.1 hypothetical protein IMG5_076390 [Ichthyophthirius multifiliis]|eukprot:XP_004036595.1 hypothetical protein IMG5_076390 [Ichthyophthirius multifiliis]
MNSHQQALINRKKSSEEYLMMNIQTPVQTNTQIYNLMKYLIKIAIKKIFIQLLLNQFQEIFLIKKKMDQYLLMGQQILEKRIQFQEIQKKMSKKVFFLELCSFYQWRNLIYQINRKKQQKYKKQKQK